MTVQNGYSTLANVKALKRVTSTDASDDAVIERLLGAASRVMESECGGRTFYPRIETRKYNIPSSRLLFLEDDLLALTTFTNGDGTVIAAADYVLEDYNATPYWAIRLRESSSATWQVDTNSSALRVLQVLGEWGYHNHFSGAWLLTDTLSAGINAAVTALPTTGSALIVQGQIIKIDNEIMNASSVVTTTTNVIKRGDNGSTAVAHLISAPIYVWQPLDDIRAACEDIVLSLYSKRFGENTTGTATITGAGVVISPKDITDFARSVLDGYRRNF